MKLINLILLMCLLLVSISCTDKDIDDEKPEVDLSFSGAFPINCDTIYFGEDFIFNAIFSDNVELGSFSIEIHHNFDHHSHTTEVTECALSPEKDPVNPFYFIQDYEIPDGLKDYKAIMDITVPASNVASDFDEGDYHFFIRLTDKEGWSAQKGLSVKMLHK